MDRRERAELRGEMVQVERDGEIERASGRRQRRYARRRCEWDGCARWVSSVRVRRSGRGRRLREEFESTEPVGGQGKGAFDDGREE